MSTKTLFLEPEFARPRFTSRKAQVSPPASEDEQEEEYPDSSETKKRNSQYKFYFIVFASVVLLILLLSFLWIFYFREKKPASLPAETQNSRQPPEAGRAETQADPTPALIPNQAAVPAPSPVQAPRSEPAHEKRETVSDLHTQIVNTVDDEELNKYINVKETAPQPSSGFKQEKEIDDELNGL
jgi:flagellar biosynthesis/type III secretory pathway M-ring protein FliF/YscJ